MPISFADCRARLAQCVRKTGRAQYDKISHFLVHQHRVMPDTNIYIFRWRMFDRLKRYVSYIILFNA